MQDPSPSTAQLRRSAAIRVGAAVLIAGGATTLAIIALWGPVDIKTDLVGYTIFANFNGYNYFNAYYLVVGFFPIASLLLFLGLTRLGPRIGLPAPPSRGSLRPHTALPKSKSIFASDPPLAAAPLPKRRAIAGARVAFVGAVLGLEAGIAADSVWLWLVLGAAIYSLATVLVAAGLDRWGLRDWSFERRLAAVNGVGSALCVAGLIAVSASTEVKVLSDGSVKHYPWFPAWLGVPVAAVIAGWVAIALRRAGPAAAAGIERRALILIAAPVCLFVLFAGLSGDSARIDTFDGGQGLVASRLVGDGWLPWRDVVIAHGLLEDVANPTISFAVFGHSYWGRFAGSGLLTGPLYLVCTYFLFVYLFGRNWLLLLLSGLIALGTVFAPTEFRFILWPLILLLLAAVLNRPTHLRSVALGLMLVAQAIVTPEATPALPAIAVVLIGYEWYSRKPGSSIASAFPRTLWFAGAAIACAAAFAIYMASRGALDDFVYVTTNLVRGHSVDGQLPPNPGGDSQFNVIALAPPAALLISFAYVVARLRLRRPLLTADWVMAAVALFVLLYYPKFLSRMDTGHAYEPFGLSLPLLLFIVYRAVDTIEREFRKRWSGYSIFRVTAHPVSLILVVVVAALAWGNLRDQVDNAPASYRPAASAPPQFERVGYTQAFDSVAYRDLKRVVDAYLSPGDRLYDLTNEDAVFFYFMDRDPSTRYFLSASVVDTAELQSDVIDRLRRAPPKLIVFDSTSTSIIGLANMDGVPNMVRLYEISRWILDHYRPLLSTHGHTFYARRDLPSSSAVHLHLAEKPVTRGVPFLSQTCQWGYAPSFLSGPGEPPPGAKSIGLRTTGVRHPLATASGWAGDAKANAPAREVIATFNGRIVGRATPRIERPDLIAGGWPPGFARSGFRVQIPEAALRKPSELHLYGVGRAGSVAELPSGTSPSPQGSVRLDGRAVHLDPTAVAGHFDDTLGAPSMQIELPSGSSWADYRWIEIDAGHSGFRQGAFAVFDRQNRPTPGREIGFQTLDRSPDRYVVPVGNCAQWHGYRSRRLFLAELPDQDIAGVRLIR